MSDDNGNGAAVGNGRSTNRSRKSTFVLVVDDDPQLATIPTLIITAGRSPEASETPGAVVLPKPLDLDRLMRAITACTGEAESDDVSTRN